MVCGTRLPCQYQPRVLLSSKMLQPDERGVLLEGLLDRWMPLFMILLPFRFAVTETLQAIPAHIQRAFVMEIGAVPTRRFRFLKTSTSLTQMTTSTKVN